MLENIKKEHIGLAQSVVKELEMIRSSILGMRGNIDMDKSIPVMFLHTQSTLYRIGIVFKCSNKYNIKTLISLSNSIKKHINQINKLIKKAEKENS